jgi:hypothetical protein
MKRVLVVVPVIAVLVILLTAAVQLVPPIVGFLFPSGSLDGLTWRKVAIPIPSDSLFAVVAGGPGFVAAGQQDVWTSADGSHWSALPDDDRTSGTLAGAFVDTLTVAHGRLFAGGSDAYGHPRVWASSDGIHWNGTSLAQAGQPTARVRSIAAGPGGLVAVGGEYSDNTPPMLWHSPDGAHWQLVDLAAQGALAGDDRDFDRIAASPTGYVALLGVPLAYDTYGTPSRMLVSADGLRWTRVAPGAGPAPPLNGGHLVNTGPEFASPGVVTSLTLDRKRLLAAGLQAIPPTGSLEPVEHWVTPVLWESVDGTRWTPTAPPPPQSPSWTVPARQLFGAVDDVVRVGDVLWAAGTISTCASYCSPQGPTRAVLWASRDDGRHWSALASPRGMLDSRCSRECAPGAGISSLAVHDGVVVAAGDDFNGALWRGTPG